MSCSMQLLNTLVQAKRSRKTSRLLIQKDIVDQATMSIQVHVATMMMKMMAIMVVQGQQGQVDLHVAIAMIAEAEQNHITIANNILY